MGCGVVFYHKGKNMSCVVHGDDFTFTGYEEDLMEMAEVMQKWFEIKVRGILGGDAEDLKEIIISGRTVRWCDWGIGYEADKKHRKAFMEQFGLDGNVKALM